MQWKLAHFGLELHPPEDIIKLSSVEITQVLPFSGKLDGVTDFENTVLDPRLGGPPVEETLLNTIGHIKLAVPVPRPECMDQIVEHINKGRPLEYPLEKFGKSKNAHFLYDISGTGATLSEEQLVVDPAELYAALASPWVSSKEIVIHGDQFTEHNVKTEPRTMMLTVLPVPSLITRPNEDGRLHPLSKKLNQILTLNTALQNDTAGGDPVPELIQRDMIGLLTYHVMTYLDNAIPGIPSDDSLAVGIAQLLGSESGLLSENETKPDIAGTTLHRIVRGINMGEAVIQVTSSAEDANSLAFELTKQVAFRRIWKKSGRDTQVVHINGYGEIQRMEIGVIEDFSWSRWDGTERIPREVVVAPRGSARLIDAPSNRRLRSVIRQLQEIDAAYHLELQQQLALNFLYSMAEAEGAEQEQMILVCDVYMDPIVLRPLLRELEMKNKTGASICLILTQMRLNSVLSYHYEPTEDAYRNLIIALTSLKERREFEHKAKMFDNARPTHLKLISTYFKGLTRTEVTQLLGESILAKGNLNPEHLREYVKSYLERNSRSTDHLKPIPLKPKRRLTTERLFPHPRAALEDIISDDVEENDESNQELEVKDSEEDDTLYSSLKGLEPLVRWAQLKGKMFTPAAAEFGFTSYPKGLLLTGVPGCGKTMAAKIIAEEWDMTLHRVNPDDITSKIVGGNEDNMRKLLKKLVRTAPSICFVDEAEKLFSQMKTEVQSAATQAIDSTESMLLQFMEENTEPVFFIFTANDMEKMSPAIIDRFEGRFFVDLPDEFAREEIISLMLYERKKAHLGLDSSALAKGSVGFTGRDIRGAIDEAMMIAFGQERQLTQEDLFKTFAEVKPTSVVHEQRIKEMRALVAEGKIRSANSPRVVINNAQGANAFDVSYG